MKATIHIILLFCFISLNCNNITSQKLAVSDTKTDVRYDESDFLKNIPSFSWIIVSNNYDVLQTAYELRVALNEKELLAGKNLCWNTGKIQSEQSTYIAYGGKDVLPEQDYFWQVRVWDNKGNRSAWSPVGKWQTGLLQNDWRAKWIRTSEKEKNEQVVFFRKEFNLTKPIKKAALYISSHGIYEAEINGSRVSEDLFTPGWTVYPKRTQYQKYDIKDLLQKSTNAIGVAVGEGWYKGVLLGVNHFYGDRIELLAQINIEYADGSYETIATDTSWKTNTDNQYLRSGLYFGEIFDARKTINNWSRSGFSENSTWTKANLSNNQNFSQLITSNAPPVRKHKSIKAQKIILTPKGEKVIDFGQNLIGWARFSVRGNKGDSVKLYHAEVLDKEGNFYTDNLRGAKQEIVYYLQGGDTETYEPHFTFQGFRYVKIEGKKELIDLDNIEAVVVYSDMTPAGSFTTSNPLLNQLQHNILWGQKSNFLEVPTDCPQRDERLGWTGDAQVFFSTATFNMDVSSFFSKWLADLRAEQLGNGGVPGIIPNIWGKGEREIGQAGWADAVTIIPWNFYLAYGDRRILEDNYNAMLKWADYIASRSTAYLWDKSWHHGDWLYFMPKDVWDHNPAYTDKTLVAQAFYANTLQNIINTANVLGKEKDVEKYRGLLQKVKDTFVREFVTASGRITSNTQTAYVLALQFDLLPETLREQAAARLVSIINDYDNHISTGFLGTPYICHVLTRYGYTDVAYKLLLQETYPSWLYPVKMGATTIWERWDGIRPDGSFQDIQMNSFNHYSYGAIGDWMYKNIGGIRSKEGSSGYKEFVVAPNLGGNLDSASITKETPYGTIENSWKIANGKMTMDLTVPVNTKATVTFPNIIADNVILTKGKSVSNSKNSTYELGSGKYSFSFSIKKE